MTWIKKHDIKYFHEGLMNLNGSNIISLPQDVFLNALNQPEAFACFLPRDAIVMPAGPNSADFSFSYGFGFISFSLRGRAELHQSQRLGPLRLLLKGDHWASGALSLDLTLTLEDLGSQTRVLWQGSLENNRLTEILLSRQPELVTQVVERGFHNLVAQCQAEALA